MKEIVFASMNPKKAIEIQRMVPDNIKILCLKDMSQALGIPQAEENGKTFQENALIKAKYWAKILNMPVLAEDSGICIDSLDGYPGVYTKRCVEQLCPESDINTDNPSELYPLLLELIAKSKNKSTKAKWVSSIAYVDSKKSLCSTEFLYGNMCECAGEREFGFDQYFMPIDSNKTLSQMLPNEKDSIGPRSKALNNIIKQLFN